MDQTTKERTGNKKGSIPPVANLAEGASLMTTDENIKVYELAKELGLDSITLIEKLKQLEIEVKSHMSSLNEQDAKTVRGHFTQKTKTSKKSSDAG